MHPEKLDCLDAYLHVITCDECTARIGDEAIATYGNLLLTAITIVTLS